MIYIGQVYLEPGQGHKLRLSNTASGQCFNGANKRYVSADAAIFTLVPQAPVPAVPATWGFVKTRFAD